MKLFGFCRIQFILRRILTQSHYQCKKQRVFHKILHTIQYSVGRFNKIFFVKLNFLCIDWWRCWLMLMLFCISVFRWQTTNKVLITFSASNQTLVRLLQSLPQLLVQHLREKSLILSYLTKKSDGIFWYEAWRSLLRTAQCSMKDLHWEKMQYKSWDVHFPIFGSWNWLIA